MCNCCKNETFDECPAMKKHLDECVDADCEICFAWINGADDYEGAVFAANNL